MFHLKYLTFLLARSTSIDISSESLATQRSGRESVSEHGTHLGPSCFHDLADSSHRIGEDVMDAQEKINLTLDNHVHVRNGDDRVRNTSLTVKVM